MPLFRPIEGSQYAKDALVALCDAYIHSPEFSGNVVEKEQKISLIRAKVSDVLTFRSRGKGWGNSPLNPNCWVESSSGGQTNIVISSNRPLEEPVQNASASQYNQRPWQARYRGELLRLWRVCAITGCSTPALLTASHIKPVILCTDEEKVDPYNGILLSKMYDKLFDAGLITFENNGQIVFSPKVPKADLLALGLDEKGQITLEDRHLPYLEFHRNKIFKP